MLNNLSLFLSTCFLFHSTLAQDRPEKIPVRLSGFLLDDDGNAISGGKLQIWQTDTLGTYDHPRSMNIEDGLDPDFQYYGTATSGEDGSYSFLTIRPEHYPARPESHIHFKIFVDDALVLTTQMYFRDENHPYPDSLQLDLSPHEEGGFSTEKNISVELGGGGNNPVTPSQASGPYYPVVDFFDVGNNLILIESVVEKAESEEDIDSSEANETASELVAVDVSSEDMANLVEDINVTSSDKDDDIPRTEISSSVTNLTEGNDDMDIVLFSGKEFIDDSEVEDSRTQVELIMVSNFDLNLESSSSSCQNDFTAMYFICVLSFALFLA